MELCDANTFFEYADMYKEGKLSRDEFQEQFDHVTKIIGTKQFEKEQENSRENWIFAGIGLVVGVLLGMFIGSKK